MEQKPDSRMAFAAPLWIEKDEQKYLGDKRIRLLEEIHLCGSLSTAAKTTGMSYKAAWDALQAMNNLADRPLTEAAAGGAGGGGTRLTDEGIKIIRLYREVEREHRASLARLTASLGEIDHYLPLLRRMTMRISARNVFSGTVSQIVRDVAVAQVVLKLKSGHEMTAVITNDSLDALGLCSGSSAYALIKASSVMISDQVERLAISARNQIRGRIAGIASTDVVGEVVLDLGAGESLTATITGGSINRLGLKEGDEAWAIIKATSVIIGVD